MDNKSIIVKVKIFIYEIGHKISEKITSFPGLDYFKFKLDLNLLLFSGTRYKSNISADMKNFTAVNQHKIVSEHSKFLEKGRKFSAKNKKIFMK